MAGREGIHLHLPFSIFLSVKKAHVIIIEVVQEGEEITEEDISEKIDKLYRLS